MRLLLVPHAETAWSAQCRYQGQTDAAHKRFRLDPASLSELERHAETAVLNRLNDVSHLREVKHAG